MKLKQPIPLSYFESIPFVKVIRRSSPEEIRGINEIHKVEAGDITFVDHPKYYQKVLGSAATFILINQELDCPEGKALIVCTSPFELYNRLALEQRPFLSGSNAVAPTAEIGEGSILQAGVFIGNHVKIGRNCILHANVSIYDYSEIGDGVIIHANTVIGADAFYYKKDEMGYQKMHSIGRAIIADNVEIGACCTITAGVSGDTVIGEGSKLDSHVHIAHGVVVGKQCLFAAQVAIAGKSRIGDRVILYGKVGVSKDLEIGSDAVVLATSNVDKSLAGGKTYFGSPVKEAREKWKEMAIVAQLPKYWDRLKSL